MAQLVGIAPEERLFARYLNDDGSATGFLKALGDRSIAEALAGNGAGSGGRSEAKETEAPGTQARRTTTIAPSSRR